MIESVGFSPSMKDAPNAVMTGYVSAMGMERFGPMRWMAR